MTTERAIDRLARQLRATPSAALAGLGEEDLDDLAVALADARRRQAIELEAAGQRAFGHLPRLLRIPISKIMRG